MKKHRRLLKQKYAWALQNKEYISWLIFLSSFEGGTVSVYSRRMPESLDEEPDGELVYRYKVPAFIRPTLNNNA